MNENLDKTRLTDFFKQVAIMLGQAPSYEEFENFRGVIEDAVCRTYQDHRLNEGLRSGHEAWAKQKAQYLLNELEEFLLKLKIVSMIRKRILNSPILNNLQKQKVLTDATSDFEGDDYQIGTLILIYNLVDFNADLMKKFLENIDCRVMKSEIQDMLSTSSLYNEVVLTPDANDPNLANISGSLSILLRLIGHDDLHAPDGDLCKAKLRAIDKFLDFVISLQDIFFDRSSEI